MNDGAEPLSMERERSLPEGDGGVELVQTASAPADFAALYEQTYGAVFGYVMRTLMHRQAAEDVTGEAFLRALRGFSTFRPERASFSAWIYRIATNAMRDHWRKHRRLVALADGDEALHALLDRHPDGASVAQQMEELEAYRQLHSEIRKLKPPYRIVIVLFYFEHKSLREIAQIVGTPSATVRWRLHRARCQLARQLNQTRRDEQ